jgi:hypothetical protein
MARIDWEEKLRHMVQALAFCLVIATVQYGFEPHKPYGPTVVHSVFIGMFIWALVDIGRHLFASSRDTGWPQGSARLVLVLGGILGGWFLGSRVADLLCAAYGLYPPGPRPDPVKDMRSSLLISLIAGTVCTYYFHSIGKRAHLERKVGEAQRHADEARLKLLETQLEPHMLFNTLANLRALIAVDPNRAQLMLDHMIAYLRATLDASRATTHSLQAEFDRLRDYLELMSIRMGPRLRFNLDLPHQLATLPVPTLLLQPLVENSIKHGLEPKVQGGCVDVRASRDDGHVLLEVCDTGVGPSIEAPESSIGFGMLQVRERLAALYGNEASLESSAADGGGCRVIVRLPYQTK